MTLLLHFGTLPSIRRHMLKKSAKFKNYNNKSNLSIRTEQCAILPKMTTAITRITAHKTKKHLKKITTFLVADLRKIKRRKIFQTRCVSNAESVLKEMFLLRAINFVKKFISLITVSTFQQVMMILTLIAVPIKAYPIETFFGNNIIDNEIFNYDNYDNKVHRLIFRWAPLVFLSPEEQFMPSSVPYFLQHTVPLNPINNSMLQELPIGSFSEKYYLFAKQPVEQLLMNTSSFLYGQNPKSQKVPAYALVTRCIDTKCNNWFSNRVTPLTNQHSFHVTYWFFYPFNEGKPVCTMSLGFLGPVPIPKVFNKCLGEMKYVGSHVGDWEHVSLFFTNSDTPERMYISTHDSGAYYKYDALLDEFVFERQETRKGILQKPNFPAKVYKTWGHPMLYSARGSHGIWSKSGVHKYFPLPRLYDTTGSGIKWKTWESLEIIDPPFTSAPYWMNYRGKWGNSQSYCHPLKKVGIDICQLSEGPTGIPTKRLNFICPKS